MQTTTLTPAAERLSAALKTLRLTHEHDGNQSDKKDYLAKCLKVVLAQLFEDGVPQELLQPLIDLQSELVHKPKSPKPAPNGSSGVDVDRARHCWRESPPSSISSYELATRKARPRRSLCAG